MSIPDNIINKKLYSKIKSEAMERFDRYPSAYASMWISKEYKKRGGKYKNKKNNKGTTRWLDEKWIQVIPYLNNIIIDCGKGDNKKACRPLKRITDKTPITIEEVIKKCGKKKVKQLANKKKNDMNNRINWNNCKLYGSGDDRGLKKAKEIAKWTNIENWNTLKVSKAKNKRFSIISPKGKLINFGVWPYSRYGTYIDHWDDKIRKAWRARHSKILKDGKPAYKNPESPEYYSWNILWF